MNLCIMNSMAWILFFLLFCRVFSGHMEPLDLRGFQFLHESCLEWVGQHHLHSVYAGLVCGHNLAPSEKKLFLDLGIYHWFVASGGHLIFLQSWIERAFTRNKGVLAVILLLYSLVCGFQPPMVRSLMSLFVSQLSLRWALFLNSSQVCLCSGLLTLLLFPPWYQSLSLQLSWLTALALLLSQNPWGQSFFISLILLPLHQTWAGLHFLYNLVLTPFFAHCLFPVTILFFGIAPWTSMGTLFWSLLIEGAQLLPSQAVSFVLPNSLACLWLYVVALQVLSDLKVRSAA